MTDRANISGGSHTSSVVPSAAQSLPVRVEDEYAIRDQQFMDDLAQLKALRSYMMRQAKQTQAGTIELGDLNLLHFSAQGRFPYIREWQELEYSSSKLYQHLDEPDRRRFLYGQIPSVVVRTAGYLGIVALGALIAAVACFLFADVIGSLANQLATFIFFLLWVGALGAIGSIAFIGMNALAVQEDATFDLLNKKLIGLRVVLGALFAVVLSLPFGYGPFVTFVGELFERAPKGSPSEALALQSVLLLLPFVLGFSTSLVIMILNQFVEAVQSFFGKRSSQTPAAPAAAPVARGNPPKPP